MFTVYAPYNGRFVHLTCIVMKWIRVDFNYNASIKQPIEAFFRFSAARTVLLETDTILQAQA